MAEGDIDVSDYLPPPPPKPRDKDPPRHAGWDTFVTAPLPSPRKFPGRPTTAKVAAKEGVPFSPHAGKPPIEVATGKAGFAAALSGNVGFDFKTLAAKLPVARDPASVAQRKELFSKFDINNNGLLSLAEIDKAVKDVIGCAALFNSKPAVMRAFQAARRANGGRTGLKGAFVERNEFRALLSYLRSYFELYAAFNRIDTSDDRRIDLDEFREGVSMLKRWGIELEPADVDREFHIIDSNGGGVILFDEFCEWAISRKLDLDDAPDGGALPVPTKPEPQSSQNYPVPKAGPDRPPLHETGQNRPQTAFGGVYRQGTRPTTANAPVGSIGWRGGGTSTRAKTSEADPVENARRQQALDAVAAAAAEGFAKALPPRAPPVDQTQEKRKQMLKAVEASAKRGVANSLTIDAKLERVWSAHHRKANPAMTQISSPAPRHVPSDRDGYMGKPSDPELAAKSAALKDGRPPPGTKAAKAAFKAAVSKDMLMKDEREWRCQRCFTRNRSTAINCVSCAQARGGLVSSAGTSAKKPAGWTNV